MGEALNPRGFFDVEDIIGAEENDRPRHARVQTRRAQERTRGKGGKVKSPRQAIAIALHEAGASKYESKRKNKRNLAKTKRKEGRGETYQQEKEGKGRVGARGERESTKAMGGKNAKRPTVRGRKVARPRKATSSFKTRSKIAKRAGTGPSDRLAAVLLMARARRGRRARLRRDLQGRRRAHRDWTHVASCGHLRPKT